MAIEFTSVVSPVFNAPEWLLPAVIVFFGIGMPVVVVVSWMFDITPEGFERTDDAPDQLPDPIADLASTESDQKLIDTPRSVAVELGHANRRQVVLLRCTFSVS